MTFDPTKPVQTRDGRKARILCTDIKGWNKPIVAAISRRDGSEFITNHNLNGQLAATEESLTDLVNIPETLWVNVYDDCVCDPPYKTREEADKGVMTGKDRIACISFKEGDGL